MKKICPLLLVLLAGPASALTYTGDNFQFAGGFNPANTSYGGFGGGSCTAVKMLANLRSTPVVAAASALVAFFVFLTGKMAWLASRGLADSSATCGCFGALVERTPGEALAQDFLLLVPALLLAWLGRPGATGETRIRAAVAAALTAAVVGLGAAAPRLPLDDVATRLRPGVTVAELCAGRGDDRLCLAGLAPALGRGEHLVVIADAGDEAFAHLAGRLNAYVRAAGDPPVTVLAELTPERRQELYWQVAPAFDLQEVPRALLRPLYRQLPRSFRLRDGTVTATWSGLPPTLGAAPAARP